MGIFDYNRRSGKPKVVFVEEGEQLKKSLFNFPSTVKTSYLENNTVYLYLYQPSLKMKAPCVLLIHSWLEKEGGYTEYIAHTLAKNNIVSCVMALPYHMRRAPKGTRSGSLFLTTDIEYSIQSVRQAIIDLRCSLDYLINFEEVDPSRIGLVGLSLGAIIMHTLMGVDERIKAGVSILGGGNLNDIVAKGVATIPLIIQGIMKGVRYHHYKRVREDFANFLREVREEGDIERVKPAWEWFLLDPLVYAHLNHPRRVLFINGIFDFVIPMWCVRSLWNALGKPPIIWLPTSHFTARIWSSLIVKKTLKYLKENL